MLKASRRITHIQRLKETGELTDDLFKTADSLGAKLAPILFQLPPNLKKDLDRPQRLLDGIPTDRIIAFEFRHEPWLKDDALDALRAHNAALCRADIERTERDADLVTTADWGYLRLRRGAWADADLAR